MAALSTCVTLSLRFLERVKTRHRVSLLVSAACSCSLCSCTTAVSVIFDVWSMSCLALDLSSSPTPPLSPALPIVVAVVAASVFSVSLADGRKRPSISSVAQDRRISGYGMRAVLTRISWLHRRRAFSSFRACSLRRFADRLDGTWVCSKHVHRCQWDLGRVTAEDCQLGHSIAPQLRKTTIARYSLLLRC
jgi:hypothetical protein